MKKILIFLALSVCFSFLLNAQQNKKENNGSEVYTSIKGIQNLKFKKETQYGEIAKDSLVNITGIECSDKNYEIISFEFSTLKAAGGQLYVRNIKGNEFTPEIIEKLRTAVVKQKIYFDNIKVKTPKGRTDYLKAVTLVVI